MSFYGYNLGAFALSSAAKQAGEPRPPSASPASVVVRRRIRSAEKRGGDLASCTATSAKELAEVEIRCRPCGRLKKGQPRRQGRRRARDPGRTEPGGQAPGDHGQRARGAGTRRRSAEQARGRRRSRTAPPRPRCPRPARPAARRAVHHAEQWLRLDARVLPHGERSVRGRQGPAPQVLREHRQRCERRPGRRRDGERVLRRRRRQTAGPCAAGGSRALRQHEEGHAGRMPECIRPRKTPGQRHPAGRPEPDAAGPLAAPLERRAAMHGRGRLRRGMGHGEGRSKPRRRALGFGFLPMPAFATISRARRGTSASASRRAASRHESSCCATTPSWSFIAAPPRTQPPVARCTRTRATESCANPEETKPIRPCTQRGVTFERRRSTASHAPACAPTPGMHMMS